MKSPGIAEEILALSRLACCEPFKFKSLVIGNKQDASLTGENSIITYLVPAESAWVVTYCFARSIPLPNGDVLLGTTAYGDFRSEDITPYNTGVAGQAAPRAWWEVNGVAQSGQAFAYQLLNRPVLFVFRANETVELVLNPGLPDAADVTNLYCALTTYLVPLSEGECLHRYATALIISA